MASVASLRGVKPCWLGGFFVEAVISSKLMGLAVLKEKA